MRYDKESGEICIGAKEFILLSRRYITEQICPEEDEPASPDRSAALRRFLPEGKAQPVTLGFLLGEHPCRLLGKADHIEGDTLTLLFVDDRPLPRRGRAFLAQCRGEGFLIAYMYAMAQGYARLTLRLLLVDPAAEEANEQTESLSVVQLERFFDKCARTMAPFAAPELHRVTKRLPTMRALSFPFPTVREGQDELIHRTYHTIARGGVLFAEAPTGIGKTISVLYPALRAMGEEKCSKIFYFTPKSTIAQAVKDTLQVLCDTGLLLRGVILYAKERLCPRGMECRGGDGCPMMQKNRLSEATLALFAEAPPVADREVLLAMAQRFCVCPHELSLSYARLCDMVVCDFNYLFDPFVYLHRFFDHKDTYALLIDEAHNLADRTRDMYSAQLDEGFFVSAMEQLPPSSALWESLAEGLRRFRALLFPYIQSELHLNREGQKQGATHGKELPGELYVLFDSLLDQAARAFLGAEDREAGPQREIYFTLRRFHKLLSLFGDGYEYFLFYEEQTLRLKLFCIDPGAHIRARIEMGGSAVFFSGTFAPVSYYRSMLGGDRSAELLSVPSPFDREQLSVSICHKISTRYAERERTLGAVLRVISATVSAKRGHYMIFTPSFAYNEMLARAFMQKHPKVRVLVQTPHMTEQQKRSFLDTLSQTGDGYLVAFCVMGGIFSEGIDLSGERLIGTVIVGTGLPTLSYEREAMAAYYEEKYEEGRQFAYVYPGLCRVLQAAGRVIRTQTDRGVIVLIDDRFDDPLYKKSLPDLWHGLRFVGDAAALRMLLDTFWQQNP